MAFFTAAEMAILSATTVRVALLAEFNFSTVSRWWNGSYMLTAGGNQWAGLGGLARVEGLREIRSGEANQVRFTLSGTSAEINALAARGSAEQTGALARTFFQLFDANWATVGNPIPFWAGLTQPMLVSRTPGEEGEGPVRSIVLPCEGLFHNRSRPLSSLYTDPDQQARFAGDLFFQYETSLMDKTYGWP